MAPSHSRQLLVWTFPTIAILLSYLWYKRKRIGLRSDPGGTREQPPVEPEAKEPEETPQKAERTFTRSLSGVETAPIDIVLPRKLRLDRSTSIVVSHDDLDYEIEHSTKYYSEPVITFIPLTERKKSSLHKSTPSSNTPIKAKNSPLNTIKSESVEDKMAQKDVVSVDEKFGELKLKETPKKKNKKQAKVSVNMNNDHQEEAHRQSSERDSANHSPADVMLASPSLSSISDNHSEVRCLFFC